MIDYIIYTFLFISVAVNITTLVLYFKLKRQQNQKKTSSELQLFLGDLMQGNGIVRVQRIDPNDIFLRSPRNG